MSKSRYAAIPTFGIIGLGNIFDRHVQALSNFRANVVGYCDIDFKKRKHVPFGKKFLTDYREMLKSIRSDWVIVATPNGLHSSMIKDALLAGHNVLCEKPMVIKGDDIDEIKKILAERPEQKLFSVLQIRFDERFQELKKKIDKSDKKFTGSLVVKIERDNKIYTDGWRGDFNMSGGLLFNIGIHYIDLLLWLFGECENFEIKYRPRVCSGKLYLKRGTFDFLIDTTCKGDDTRDLTFTDGESTETFDITANFRFLHRKIYENLLDNKGLTIEDVEPSIRLCEKMTSQGMNQTKTYGG